MHANCGMMNTQKSHIIEIEKLELGEHLFDFQLDNSYFSTIEASEVLGGEVDAKVRLIVEEDSVAVDVDLCGTVQVTCDRCLEPMDVEVDVYEEDVDLEEEPQMLDMAWLAYELIIVNLPLVHSHQDGGCNPQMAALLQDHLCTEIEDENDIEG